MLARVVMLLHAFERVFVMFDVMLAPLYNTTPSPHGGGSTMKMIPLDDDEEHIQEILT